MAVSAAVRDEAAQSGPPHARPTPMPTRMATRPIPRTSSQLVESKTAFQKDSIGK